MYNLYLGLNILQYVTFYIFMENSIYLWKTPTKNNSTKNKIYF